MVVRKENISTSWDFRGANTKMHTHCFHSYPAMMIPQVAGRLIDEYGKNAKLLFDPYCGTGTSLVEANLRGINAIGTDLNPLARLISKAKTTPLPLDKIDTYIEQFRTYIVNPEPVEIPKFKNIDYWFSKEVKRKLAIVKSFITKISGENIANFFKVAFSETVRESSWTRNGEFKLFRMPEKKMVQFNPDVFAMMNNKLYRNRRGLESFMKDKKRDDAWSKIYDFNTVDEIPEDVFRDQLPDIIVTSPPYGDSHTTVAYGQFSRLSSQWLGFKNANKVDRILMGGRPKNKEIMFEYDELNKIIKEIKTKDPKRAKEVVSFYDDYRKSIKHVAKIIKKGGYACYVVGNRRAKGITLPTDAITRKFFEINGFEHIKTIVRNIPNKKMPSKNSPTNIVGKLDTTMNNEYIVIMKKA